MKTCERCGQSFSCGAQQPQTCWCHTLPPNKTIPDQYLDCLCPECLAHFANPVSNSKLIEGQDYYLENGLLVFTEKYHLKKGSCCQNDCRHCPYKSN